MAGIVRVLQLSESWLQQYVNDCYAEVVATSRLVVQMDELWSFVEDLGEIATRAND